MTMATKWMRIIAARKRNQRGTTLVEVVTTIALFMAVGGSFVYAAVVMEDARKTSLEQTQTTISESGIATIFRSDIGNAKGIQLNDLGSDLSVAKSDGSCVLWSIMDDPETSDAILVRSKSPSGAPSPEGAPIASGIAVGTLSASSDSAGISLDYSSGSSFTETVPLELAGNDGGVCW